MWQGGDLPVPWPTEAPEEHESGYLDADPLRVPPDVRGVAHPDWYNEVLTLKWSNWIIQGQNGELPTTRIFQFRRIDETHSEMSFRDSIHPASTLRYGPESRLFVARMLAVSDNDQVARSELHFQCLLRPGASRYAPFTIPTLHDITTRCTGLPSLLKLLVHVVEYEAIQPIHVSDIYIVRVLLLPVNIG